MDELIAVIHKNSTEQIRVTTTEFQRKQYIGIRIYFEADDGTWRPTRKGITVRTSLVGELVTALQKATA